MTAAKKQKQIDLGDDPDGDNTPPQLEAVAEPPAAAEVETDKVPTVTIPFRGRDFTIAKAMDEWETEACLAMNEGNYIAAAKMLLGPMQWTYLMALGDKRKDVREFLSIFADVVDKECIA